MIPLFFASLLVVVVTAKPSVPSTILSSNELSSVATSSSANSVSSQTIEARNTNLIHYYRPLDKPTLPNSYVKQDQEIGSPNILLDGKDVATPYGHHGFNLGHVGQWFNHHALAPSFFWYPPGFSLPPAPAPALASAPSPTSEAEGPAGPVPITIPIIPFAAQVLNQLFWLPLEQLLISVNQSLLQAPKDDKNMK